MDSKVNKGHSEEQCVRYGRSAGRGLFRKSDQHDQNKPVSVLRAGLIPHQFLTIHRDQKINTNFLWTKFCESPSGHGRPRRISWTSMPKALFSCRAGDGEKLCDPQASRRKVQECPQEIRTKMFMFMLFFFPNPTGGCELGAVRDVTRMLETCSDRFGTLDTRCAVRCMMRKFWDRFIIHLCQLHSRQKLLCKKNSEKTVLCVADMRFVKKITPKPFFPCKSLSHKRICVMYVWKSIPPKRD